MYEEARRPKGTLPRYLREYAPDDSFVRYERHGVEDDGGEQEPATAAGAVVGEGGKPAAECPERQRTLYFLFSLDGEVNEGRWFRAEMRLDVGVLARARAALGEAGFDEALLAVGLCAACWLLMEQPRMCLRVRAGRRPRSRDRSSSTPDGDTGAGSAAAQLAFWESTVRGTLAEFQYLNRLSFYPKVLDDREVGDDEEEKDDSGGGEEDAVVGGGSWWGGAPNSARDGVLVPLGGGKDCLTLLELLRDAGVAMHEDACLFHLADDPREWRDNWRLAALHRAAGVRRVVRFIFVPPRPDPSLEEEAEEDSDEEGGLFGAVMSAALGGSDLGLVEGTPPWAAMVCFAAVLAAAGEGCHYIAVGNERSANEGNGVTWLGEPVNHQYDKSFPWEARAHAYIRACIAPGLWYFSGLMHWWEVQIAERFARPDAAARYLALFLSCNTPVFPSLLGKSRWCSSCPKCAFVFLLLAARLQPAQAWGVFGENLFEVEAALPIFRALLGLVDPADAAARRAIKPLECVGTVGEARFSLLLAADRYTEDAHPGYSCACAGMADGGGAALLPRNLAQLLRELAAAGVVGDAEAQLRASHMGDLNTENLIPNWLLPAATSANTGDESGDLTDAARAKLPAVA